MPLNEFSRPAVITVLSALFLAANAFPKERDKSISFRDRVTEISLAPTGDSYRVAFRARAAYYRTQKRDQATAACLKQSARTSEEVFIKAEGEKLIVLDCKHGASDRD